jgi:alkylated DNA repair dioxygenase AlkB
MHAFVQQHSSMDAFVLRKRKRHDGCQQYILAPPATSTHTSSVPDEDESTEFKLALLASLHPGLDGTSLLEALLAADGSIEEAANYLSHSQLVSSRKPPTNPSIGYQSSLTRYRVDSGDARPAKKPLVQKGKTLYLYSPEDVEAHTPCSIIHNFLPSKQANALLSQLLDEAPTYQSIEFKLFDRVVTSPHTFCFYVNSLAEAEQQKTEYIYDGRRVEASLRVHKPLPVTNTTQDVRQSPSEMLNALPQVEDTVNREIRRRIEAFYPDGKKLKYQSPHPWKANTAFVNCYDGPQEHVGYHADQLTYIGPRAIIGSLSLGVAREFRVRKIAVSDDEERADVQGQVSIHLPHNSLLIMHAEMQEEWKHSIAPATAIDPHPLAKNKRLNVTYRFYKDNLHPRYTPKCKCGIPTVLRCATRKKESRGRYMWMCHAHYSPGQDGCSFFQWAEFDDDGEPPWARVMKKVEEEARTLEKAKEEVGTTT